MSTQRTLRTTLCWQDGAGHDCEAEVMVHYSVDPGFAGDRIDPPCDASVEITAITSMSRSVPSRFYDDDDLKLECMADWADDLIAAEEFRAEQRRDDRLMEDQ